MPETTEAGNVLRLFVALLAIAALGTLVARRLAIPYTVVLLLIGLTAGLLVPDQQVVVTPDVVLLGLLPGLVFESALRMDVGALRRVGGGIALLAIPGVIVTAVITAFVMEAATGLPFRLGFVVGAMVAATDPVAVVATFKPLGVPSDLAILVEGESVFNDGTSLVVFAIALRAVTVPISPLEGGMALLGTIVGSALIGLGAGYLASRIIERLDDHLVEVLISLATAYGTFVLADTLHESGVIATVVAGIVIGHYARRSSMRPRTEDALDTVWEFFAFVLTLIAFVLIGLAIPIEHLIEATPAIAWAALAVLVARVAIIYGLLGTASRGRAVRTKRPPLPTAWLHVMFWAGLRGAVAVAMAISLPASFPERDRVQAIVFGVVLFTLLVQGSTAERVVGFLLRNEPSRASTADAPVA